MILLLVEAKMAIAIYGIFIIKKIIKLKIIVMNILNHSHPMIQ